MKRFILGVIPVLCFIGALCSKATAQDTPSPEESSRGADRSQTDSLPPAPRPKLLPANMSFLEHDLWDEDGFLRKIGIAGSLNTESRKEELTARRTMLTMHQIGGFVTLGLMGTAAYAGQMALDGKRSFRNVHQTFVTATIATYSATALLAALSPPPLIRRDEVSTTTIHKTLAWIHFAGMIVTPILGSTITRRSPPARAHVHQISAYITTATFAASMIVITF